MPKNQARSLTTTIKPYYGFWSHHRARATA
jgi:hypothetical protein